MLTKTSVLRDNSKAHTTPGPFCGYDARVSIQARSASRVWRNTRSNGVLPLAANAKRLFVRVPHGRIRRQPHRVGNPRSGTGDVQESQPGGPHFMYGSFQLGLTMARFVLPEGRAWHRLEGLRKFRSDVVPGSTASGGAA